jgi:hypothetical protein
VTTRRTHTTASWNLRRHAVAIAASTVVLALAGLNTANAQSNASGTVYGTVTPGTGATVLVENVATGFKRSLTPDATGRFSASALPTGTYKATLLRDGKVVSVSAGFEVLLGRGSEIAFADGQTQVVQVTGLARRLDMSSTSNGANFTARQLDALPIARNLDAIIQLAPNTTRADPRYVGGASIGGGAPSENSYYINGFPVTNPLNQLGSMELPFGAISQANITSGGFGAEFGRSIGGVVNIVTKSGGNQWEGGASASVSPSGLRSAYKDRTYANTGFSGNAKTDGSLYWRGSDHARDDSALGAYLSGPIVEDKLFLFVAVERIGNQDKLQVQAASAYPASGFLDNGWGERKNTNDRYFAKFDWNLTKNHVLELSLLGDKYKREETVSGYNVLTGEKNGITKSTATFVNDPLGNTNGVGGTAQILKYTGYLNDDLTVTALVGKSESPHINTYGGVNVFSTTPQVRADTSTRYPGFTYTNPYPFAAGTTVLSPGSKDQVGAMRFDLEYKLGAHLLRAGVDQVTLKSINAGEVEAGGSLVRYFRTTNKSPAVNGVPVPVGATPGVLTQPNPAGTTPANSTYYYYGYEQIFTTTTNAESNQSAMYLEDKWQVNKDLLLIPGLRVEKYGNVNGDGETFLKVKTQVHPRFAFTYDLLGDKTTKLLGSAGRYGVQIPTHLAVRGASRSTYTRQAFIYTGVDANGAPIGRVNLSDPTSSNNEYGQAKDANTVAALNMKPNSQDELTLGIERALSNKLNVGAKATYRNLAATIDDLCDPRPFEAYAAKNKIDTSNWGGFGCASFNPGMANSFLVDYSGKGQYTKVNLSAADLGFDKAKRTYFALDFFAEHPFTDGWYGKVTYTFSQSKGNTEGQTLSDVAQTDVAATQTWDHPELMQGAYGYLPNDRRHQIKAYGFLSLTPELTIGANALAASGRPKNCIGNFGGTPSTFAGATTTASDLDYGSAYRYCTVDGVTTYAPRGSAGNLPWDTRLDVNLSYRPSMFKGLQFRLDVFNLVNRQTVQAIDEVHEVNGDPTSISPTYGRVISYTAPRSVKFTATYDYKF